MSHNMLLPMPLELLKTPKLLSGEAGTNRAPNFVVRQIEANHDLQAIQCWLAEFESSPQTYRTYKKEAERLLLWALIEKQKPFSSLTRDDLRDYQQFLLDPHPKERWCGPRKPRHDPYWRPFEGALSPGSAAHALTIVNALFSYLVEAGYLAGNPLGLMRRKLKKYGSDKRKVTERFLEQALWQAVVDFIESLPKLRQREQKEYQRVRFLFYTLYLLGPRVSEIANAKMESIKQIRGKWWWEVTGKGQKTQLIPLNDSMLSALMQYRQFHGLSPLPQRDEVHSLILSLNARKGVCSNMIYRIVKKTFLDCAKNIEESRPDFAIKLKKASTHWMRHTSITHQADRGIELRYIQRHARHQSVETTMLYQHAEEDHWHKAMERHRIEIKQPVAKRTRSLTKKF